MLPQQQQNIDETDDSKESSAPLEPLEIENGDESEEMTGLVSSHADIGQTAKRSARLKKGTMIIFIFMIVVLLLLLIISLLVHSRSPSSLSNEFTAIYSYPKMELLRTVYDAKDFENELHVTPPYWEDVYVNRNDAAAELHFNQSYESSNSTIIPHLGPCFLPNQKLDWQKLIKKNRSIESKASIKYANVVKRHQDSNDDDPGDQHDLSGLCRPGFIIIGQGKCGTSSLYHYLVGHPRVLPAKNKQIHYFKYWSSRPMKWYLANFPPAKTFLSNGALMTGEASPGYLPYPSVAHILGDWMQSKAGNGQGQPVGAPKIITIVRNPLERSWSSYKYNYRNPLLERLHKAEKYKQPHTDEWYMRNKIFSFEELIRAELNVLKVCLKPGGLGETGARDLYGLTEWGAAAMEQRTQEGKLPLVTIDESCYGARVSKSVPRLQWEKMVEKYPKKIIDVPNLHLVQSLIGRSLYALPLEWWYALYSKKDLYIVCSEDLRHRPKEVMSNVSDFLGLPSFDFTNVTSAGLYNVGGHTGYDTVTRWNNTNYAPPDTIPISKELRNEYLNFVNPFNERLFQLIGKRCNW
mmetsp:Transcript_16231/g.30698  ORF Transcript_16231/g.30698 Transcript_16231/m.30698 type:complete len:578 (+) Transcript_16231:2344-4077(+)